MGALCTWMMESFCRIYEEMKRELMKETESAKKEEEEVKASGI